MERVHHLDCRLERVMNDGIKEKSIKSYENKYVISTICRYLISNSTELESQPNEAETLVRYSTRLHEELAKNYLFTFSKIHIATKGLWTCPMRSFYILCHNQPIPNLEFHSLIMILKATKTAE